MAIDPFPEVDGGSPGIAALKRDMLRVASDPDVTVLILGQSGTGKERVARAIHRLSPRGHAPFEVVNCAGLTPTLVEDELFGHVRGAFTGAVDDRPGPFERASGGTVFLDEVGELTTDLQMKLLRALQQRTVRRLGGRRETIFDVRVIAATNVDLACARARGRFREDLYYRLKVFELRVPPLRSRGTGDLRLLVAATLARLASKRSRPTPEVADDVFEWFTRYRWPGNVRELENTLERMIVAAGRDPRLTREHLPDDFGLCGMAATEETAARVNGVVTSSDLAAALERNGFRCGRAARDVGLSRHQMYRLMKRYGVQGRRGRPPAGRVPQHPSHT